MATERKDSSRQEDWVGDLIDGCFASTAQGGLIPLLFFLAVPLLIVGKMARAFSLNSATPYAMACLALAIPGFIMFSIAKLSLFRQGHVFSHGSDMMTPRNRRMYRLGYLFIFCSAAMAWILAKAHNLVEPDHLDYAMLIALAGFYVSMICSILWRVFVPGEFK